MMEITCWVEGEVPHTRIEHYLLNGELSRDVEDLFSHITFTKEEIEMYPQLVDLDMDEDGYELLEPKSSLVQQYKLRSIFLRVVIILMCLSNVYMYMTTPLDNTNLQEYLNIPMELSKYSKQELLDMNPSGASYIPPTWTERKIRDTLLAKRNTCITYLNQYKESLSLFRIGMLISIDNSNSIYLINGYEVNEGFSISTPWFMSIEEPYEYVGSLGSLQLKDPSPNILCLLEIKDE